MTGIVIYKGRRNIRHTIDGRMTIVKPLDIFRLPLEQCMKLVDADARFRYDEPTARMVKGLRMGRQNCDRISGILAGRDCFIVGRGPSLIGFDFNILKDSYIMTINDSFDAVSVPDAVVFVDGDFITKRNGEYLEKLKAFDGFIFCAYKANYEKHDKRENVYSFSINRNTPTLDIDCGIYNGQLSGVAAINIALIMGAGRIFLLGYDLNPKSSRTHFDVEQNKTHYMNKQWCNLRIQQFRKFEDYKKNIFNCNPESNLDIFDYMPIEEALKK